MGGDTVGKGLLGGALIVGLLSWVPLNQHWPLIVAAKNIYDSLLDRAAMLLFSLP
jgi:hypothetical protein